MFSFSRELLSIRDSGILTSPIIWFCHHSLSLHHHLQPSIGSGKSACREQFYFLNASLWKCPVSLLLTFHQWEQVTWANLDAKRAENCSSWLGSSFPETSLLWKRNSDWRGHQPTTTHHLVPHDGEKTPRKSFFFFWERERIPLYFLIFVYLFLFWLHQVLVVAHRIFAVARGFLSSVALGLQRTGFSSCGV